MCRDPQRTELINKQSARLVAEVNQQLPGAAQLSAVQAFTMSATEAVLVAVLNEALDRIDTLSDELGRMQA